MQEMVTIYVKKYCVKNGKVYGPYPKDPVMFYRYKVYRDGDTVKQVYLGKGPKPKGSVVQELGKNCKICRHFTLEDDRPFCEFLKAYLTRNIAEDCEAFSVS